MKITREEACRILDVDEGSDNGTLKKAYFKKSREWHPDKRALEERKEATVMFQRVSAAYQKLTKEVDSDDDEEFDDYDLDDDDPIFEFFAYMQAKMEAQRGQRYGRRGRGCSDDPFAEGMDGYRGRMGNIGGIPIPTPFGFMFLDEESMGSGGPGGIFTGVPYRAGKPRQARPAPSGYQHQPGKVYASESDSDEWETDDDDNLEHSDCGDFFESLEQEFLRTKSEGRTQEQDRVRAENEADVHQARENRLRDRNWLQRLPRPARTAYTETSISLSVIKGIKSRMGFVDGKLPEGYCLEVQHCALPEGQPPGPWSTLQVEAGTLEVEVGGLDPGTKYSFRVRPCKRQEWDGENAVQCGPWSVERIYATAEVAQSDTPVQTPKDPLPGAGKKGRSKAKQGGKAKLQQPVDKGSVRARELEQIQEEKDAVIKAAVAAAAAAHKEHSAAAAPPALRQRSVEAQSKKAKKKKKKAGAAGGPCRSSGLARC